MRVSELIESVPRRVRLAIKATFLAVVACGLTAGLLLSHPGKMLPQYAVDHWYVRIPDTVQHFVGYSVFAFALLWYRSVAMGRALIGLVGLAVLHAMSTEFLQGFVPHRTPDVRDFFANLLGITTGTLLGVLWIRRDVWFARRAKPKLRLAFSEREPVRREPRALAAGQWANARSESRQDFRCGPTRTAETLGEFRYRTSFNKQWDARPLVLAAPAQTTPGIGLTRVGNFEDADKDAPVRKINYRLLGITFISGVLLLGSLWKIRGWQVRRQSMQLYDRSLEAKAAGDASKARSYMGRFVGMAPGNIRALAEYGQMIDEDADTPKEKRRAFMIYERVLREQPDQHDIRRRQVELAIDIERINDAQAHLHILRQSFPQDGHLDFLVGRCSEQSKDDLSAIKGYKLAVSNSPHLIEAYDRLARLLHDNDEPEAAVELLDDMLLSNPTSAEAYVVRGKFRQDFGSLRDAAADINRALELDGASAPVHLAVGQLAFEQAKVAKEAGLDDRMQRVVGTARTRLQDAIKLHGEDIELILQLAHIESYFGDPKLAAKWFTRVLELDKEETRALAGMADLMVQVGKFERAREYFKRLPRSPDADALRQFLEARVLMVEQKWGDAHDRLEMARRVMSEDSGLSERTDLVIAKVLAQMGEQGSQEKIYRRILKDNAASVPASLGLASSHLRAGRLDDAIAEYRQLLHVPKVRLLLAQLLMIQNSSLPEEVRDWTEVEDMIDSAAEAETPAAIAMLRAELLAIQGRHDAARAVIEEAQASQTDRAEFWLALAKIAEHGGDEVRQATWRGRSLLAAEKFKDAEAELRKAVEIQPSNPEPLVMLLLCLHRDGRDDEAAKLHAEQYHKHRELQEPGVVAECYAAMNKLDSAEKYFRFAIRKQPKNSSVVRGLAKLYLRTRRFTEAVPLLKQLTNLGHVSSVDANWGRRNLAIVLASRGSLNEFRDATEFADARSDDAKNETAADKRVRAIVLASNPHPKNRREAIRLFEELSDLEQMTLKDRWLLAQLYERDGQMDTAVGQFESVLRTSRRVTVGQLVQFVDVLLSRGDHENAAKWIARLKPREWLTWRTTKLEVWLHAFGDDATNAASMLRTAAEEVAGQDKIVVRTFDAAGHARRIAASMTAPAKRDMFNRVAEELMLTQVEHRPDAAYQVMTMRAERGDKAGAFEACRQAWDRFDAETSAKLSLAMMSTGEWSDGDWAEIEGKVNAAIELRTASVPLQVSLADLHTLRGDLDEAEAIYRRILDSQPKHVIALNNLAWMQALSGSDAEEAKQLIDRAIELAGQTPQLLDTLACVLLQSGEAPTALAEIEHALNLASNADGFARQAVILAKLERWEDAIAAFREATRMGFHVDRMHRLEREAFASTLVELRSQSSQ